MSYRGKALVAAVVFSLAVWWAIGMVIALT